MIDYGKEIILDLHHCNAEKFTRLSIGTFFAELCELIDMEACELHFWDDLHTAEAEKQTEPHLVGTSAIQFITTSNVTIHTLDIMERVYINLFSCKGFDSNLVAKFSKNWFEGEIVNQQTVRRI